MVLRFSLLAVVLLALTGCSRREDSQAPGQNAAVPQSETQDRLAAGSQLAALPEGTSAEELVAQAEQMANSGDLPRAIELTDQVLKAEPNHPRALFVRAQLAYAQGLDLVDSDRPAANALFVQSAQMMRRLRDTGVELEEPQKMVLAMAIYNEACSFALGGQRDKAIASLKEALESGFNSMQLLDSDSDLVSLRESPEFQALLSQARENMRLQFREEARQELADHEPFDFTFSLPDLAGVTVSLDAYMGKVTIVDFWGTWCPPCRMEIPHFIDLYRKYQEAGLAVVGINYERLPPEEWNAAIKAFVDESKIPYPCLIGDQQTMAQVPEFEGFPTTLFVDRSGVVRLKIVGYHPYDKLEAIALELLDEKPEKSGE